MGHLDKDGWARSWQHDDIEQWPFNDAPRLLRVQAVEKIPELLEAILESAAEMAKRIAEKAEEVEILTAAMAGAADSHATPTPSSAFRTKLDDALAEIVVAATHHGAATAGAPAENPLGITGLKARK